MREIVFVALLAWTLAAQQGLCGKLEKIAQQPSNVLEDYYAYRHVSIIHFDVPERTVAVAFKYVSNQNNRLNRLQFNIMLTFSISESFCTHISSCFRFTAKEEKTGGIGKCPPRNVSLHLKSGSLPFVRPDGSKVAAKLMKRRRRYYSLEMQSGGDQYIIKIEAPPAGDWYAIAFRSWTDPDSGKIRQQGRRCSLPHFL